MIISNTVIPQIICPDLMFACTLLHCELHNTCQLYNLDKYERHEVYSIVADVVAQYRISGTFDGDLIWWFGIFVLNCQTKVTINTIFRWHCEVS